MARDPAWLLEHKRDVYSQTGEDGVIEAILDTLEERDHWCVEFGAWDGQHLSNTRHLIESRNYKAVLIEGDSGRLESLRAFYKGNERIFPVNAFVGFDEATGLDAILRDTPIPIDFDFLSIDIDGNDYHVWNAIRTYRPKVICIEFNPTIPSECVYVQNADPSLNHGSSVAAYVELARSKGYQLASLLPFNAFFVRDDLFPRLDIADNSIHVLRKDVSQLTYLFQGFNGAISVHGNRMMPWHGLQLEDYDFQILPKMLRKFPSAYSPLEAGMFAAIKQWRVLRRKFNDAINARRARFN